MPRYIHDYPWVPEEERAFVDNQTLVVRKFSGEGELPPVFLNSETRVSMSEVLPSLLATVCLKNSTRLGGI